MKFKQLDLLVEQLNGYLPLDKARELGISKAYIQQYIKENNFERVAHGLYKSSDAWTDNLYILALKNERMVYSLDTALMLHGLTEREPSEIYATVSRAYNASHLRTQGILVNYVREEWLDLGKTIAVTSYGNEVPVYDMERTICDLLRAKRKKDPQMFAYAMKEYAKSSSKNLHRLMNYATEFGVADELRQYMEVLL